MAVTALWAVKGWLGKVVIYAENPDKTKNPAFYENQSMTEKQMQGLSDVISYASQRRKTMLSDENAEIMRHFVTGINCQSETARTEMMAVKKHFNKTEGVIAYHGYQSFAPGEATPEMAHEIGVKLAERLWGERYQVIVATHLDKVNHLHSHFVLNNVSMTDGKKFYRSKQDYRDMVRESDALCLEYNLSVIHAPKYGKTKHYAEWQAEKDGRLTWRGILKAEVDEAISQSMTEYHFITNMKRRGYEVKLGKHVAVRPPGKERFFRLQTNFGETYSREGIMRQMRGRRPAFPKPEPKRQAMAMKLNGTMKNAKKLTGFRALYFHYLYLMGKVPKKRQRPSTSVHFLFREDLLKIDRISNEVTLLCRNRIDTSEQLFSYKSVLTERMETLTTERTELRKRLRRVIDEPYKTEIKAKIAMLTKGLGEARKEVALCDDIYERSKQIKEKRRIVSRDNNLERKEKTRNEPFR